MILIYLFQFYLLIHIYLIRNIYLIFLQITFAKTPANLPPLELFVNILDNKDHPNQTHTELRNYLMCLLFDILISNAFPEFDDLGLRLATEFPNRKNRQGKLYSNFRTAHNFFMDIAIVRTDNVDSLQQFGVIVAGEVKMNSSLSTDDVDNELKRLLNYQIHFGRPYWQEGFQSRVLGFAMDFDCFIIQELTVEDWLTSRIFEITLSRKYTRNAEDSDFHARCFQVLLRQLATGLREHNPRSNQTFRFPFHSSNTLMHCNVVDVAVDEVVHQITMDKFEFGWEGLEALALEPGSRVVMKATCSFFSGGKCYRPQFLDLLRRAVQPQVQAGAGDGAEAESAGSTFLRSISSLYIGMLTQPYPCKITFTLMRFFGGLEINCDSKDININWDDIDIRRNFFHEVYRVSMGAIESNWLHWDIRRGNVLFVEKHFRIIDWESSIPIDPDLDGQINTRVDNFHGLEIYKKLKPLAHKVLKTRLAMLAVLQVELILQQFIRP